MLEVNPGADLAGYGQIRYTAWRDPTMLSRLTPAQISPWLAAAYAIHLLDERFVGDGVAEWATRVAGMPFSNSEWLLVNLPSLAVVLPLAWAIRTEKLGAAALLLVAGHVLMHATMHLGGAIQYGEFSPGIVSGVAVCLPLSLLAIRLGFSAMHAPRASLALLAGIATFQPIWHQLLVSVAASSSHAV